MRGDSPLARAARRARFAVPREPRTHPRVCGERRGQESRRVRAPGREHDRSDGLSWWWRSWQDDALEDHPMIEVAFDWLEEHAPVTEQIALVHGDYRSGKFLFDPETNRTTTVLDWEMARLGDRHEDLGWTLARLYTVVDPDGTEL